MILSGYAGNGAGDRLGETGWYDGGGCGVQLKVHSQVHSQGESRMERAGAGVGAAK